MKIKITFLSIIIFFIFGTSSYSTDYKNECSNINKWNVIKKMECKIKSATDPITSKVDESTKSITSKKTLADFFKKKKND